MAGKIVNAILCILDDGINRPRGEREASRILRLVGRVWKYQNPLGKVSVNLVHLLCWVLAKK